MAEAAPSRSRDVLCQYFANGVCRFGDNCHFSHDRTRAAPDNTCRYYLKGNCSYGNRCRYEHVRSQQTPAQSTRERRNGAQGALSPSRRNGRTTPTPILTNLNSSGGARSKRSDADWARAEEFVPSNATADVASYKDALRGFRDLNVSCPNNVPNHELCPFFAKGECPYAESCQYLHGAPCELCGKNALHPFDEDQRKQHSSECMKVLEDDMKLSFAISRSSDKICGVCMETVMEKSSETERRFGILTGCNHVFCLSCIREWRARKEYKHKVVRACPECRVHSDFIVPSPFWFEDSDEKEKMINEYKKQLSKKPCKYFDKGRGKCPFGSACFYLHAYPDGSVAKDEEPPRPRTRRVRTSRNTVRAIQESLLWDFLEEREERGDGFASFFELDDDFILRLINSVGDGDADSDDDSSAGDAYSDDYYDASDNYDSDDDDDVIERLRFTFSP